MLAVLAGLLGSAGVPAGRAAPADAPADPRRAVVAELTTLLEREPHHVGALYYGARVLAGIGDHAAALRWLDRLEEVGLGDELDPDDFGSLAASPAFRERAARFAAAAPPTGQARLVREIASADLLPEGTAWDPQRRELLLSSGRRRTVLAVDESGCTRDVLPPADGRIMAVMGLSVDPATDTLWAATAAAPFMTDVRAGEERGACLARIGLKEGRVLQTYRLAGHALLNDVVPAADGSVYVTESVGGTVYRLAPRDETLRPILPPGTWEGPNGIVVLASGDLLVADFHGLSLVHAPSSPAPRSVRLTTPGDLYLGGIDGLARFGERVIGIQNLIGRSRLWSLAIAPDADRIIAADLLLRGHRDFLNPTTGAVVGDKFLFLADTKLQRFLPDGTVSPLPAGRLGHRLLSLDLAK